MACPNCGARLRPDVVWFGEQVPSEAIARVFQFSRECDLFISVGTSTVVQPAASLPLRAIKPAHFSWRSIRRPRPFPKSQMG